VLARSMLVTGGAGFIGANFVRYWLKQHPETTICVLDSLTYAGNVSSLPSREKNTQLTFVEGDIVDQQLVENLLLEKNIDTVVHFAAESHVDRSISCPDRFINTNIIGTHSLLKAAKTVWLDRSCCEEHRFHHVSTDEVYGTLDLESPPFSEQTPYAPNSPYAASKAASDHLVRAYHHTYGLNVTTSNCSNNYGPYHYPEKLIPLIITNILNNKPLPVYGDGLQVRDWLYVEDHARAIELVLDKGQLGQTYNIGGCNEWKNIDIVNLVCRLMNRAFDNEATLKERFPRASAVIRGRSEELITFVEDRLGHDRRYAINPSKAENELGYSPQETFESGINKTVAWYLSNQAWWGPLIAY